MAFWSFERKVLVMDIAEIALSTSWNGAGILDGWEIVRGVLALGLKAMEVEYRVREEAIAGIESAVRQGLVKVTSVHNFAPLGKDEKPSPCGGDKLSLASLCEKERKEAVQLTCRSIDLANRLGAKAVVLHLGEVEGIKKDYFGRLTEIAKAKGAEDDQAKRIREDVIKLRDDLKAAHLDAAVTSLKQLVPVARQYGIILGIENRYFYHQIPMYSDVAYLISRSDPAVVRYWHDIGHGHAMEVLGFFGHIEWLERLKPHLFGIHIHDARFINDHIPPGFGEIDLSMIIKTVGKDCLKVLEFASTVTKHEIVQGIEYLKAL